MSDDERCVLCGCDSRDETVGAMRMLSMVLVILLVSAVTYGGMALLVFGWPW